MQQEIIYKYYNDIYKWSYSKTKNKFDAEDLTQEIIYQILKTLNKDVFVIELEKYLWKIAYYVWCAKAKDYIKNKQVTTNTDFLITQIDTTTDIHHQIEFEEIKNMLDNIINTFDNRMSEIVKMYYYDNLKIKTISEILQIKESLVKYYLYEGKNKIKENLKKEME